MAFERVEIERVADDERRASRLEVARDELALADREVVENRHAAASDEQIDEVAADEARAADDE